MIEHIEVPATWIFDQAKSGLGRSGQDLQAPARRQVVSKVSSICCEDAASRRANWVSVVRFRGIKFKRAIRIGVAARPVSFSEPTTM